MTTLGEQPPKNLLLFIEKIFATQSEEIQDTIACIYFCACEACFVTVRPMLQVGKMEEIADELKKYNIQITALQEVRWPHYGWIK